MILLSSEVSVWSVRIYYANNMADIQVALNSQLYFDVLCVFSPHFISKGSLRAG